MGDSGTGRQAAADSGAGVASGSAEEATLAHHMQRAQQRQSDGSGAGAAGVPNAAGLGREQQERHSGLPRSATAPPPALLALEAQKGVPSALLAGPSRLPAIATRLPPHLRRAGASGSAGGSAGHTPMSEQSASSAWSDSGAGCCCGGVSRDTWQEG